MKIIFSAEDFYPPVSGGDISVLTLFEKLAENHIVDVVCSGNKNEIININGIRVFKIKSVFSKFPSWARRYFLNKFWIKILSKHLKKNKYDLLITQSVLTPASITMARKMNIRTIVFVRSYEHFCLSHLRDVEKPKKHNCLKHARFEYKIQYPFFKSLVKWHEQALRSADILAANSKFMQNIINEWYDIKSKVIYPFIKLEYYKSKKKNPKYITLIRPEVRKGVEIFLKLADRFPEKMFLAVGKTDRIRKIKRRKNVVYIPWTNNMKKVYAQTKILLVPSIWFEPFGRVTVEAMCNGIPCIVSNRGGPPEAVGKAGIVLDSFDIDVWVEAVKKLEDLNLYKKLSKKSRERAKIFDFKCQYKRFKKLMKKLF